MQLRIALLFLVVLAIGVAVFGTSEASPGGPGAEQGTSGPGGTGTGTGGGGGAPIKGK